MMTELELVGYVWLGPKINVICVVMMSLEKHVRWWTMALLGQYSECKSVESEDLSTEEATLTSQVCNRTMLIGARKIYTADQTTGQLDRQQKWAWLTRKRSTHIEWAEMKDTGTDGESGCNWLACDTRMDSGEKCRVRIQRQSIHWM